jgi:hypothetical protein
MQLAISGYSNRCLHVENDALSESDLAFADGLAKARQEYVRETLYCGRNTGMQ